MDQKPPVPQNHLDVAQELIDWFYEVTSQADFSWPTGFDPAEYAQQANRRVQE